MATTEGIPVEATMPTHAPALMVIIREPATRIPASVLMAAGDFERCIAWTIIAQEGLTE